MTERERNAVEALKRLLSDVRDDGTISPSMLNLEFAADALAAYNTPDNPPMVPWDEFVAGREFSDGMAELPGGVYIGRYFYNCLRDDLKGGE